MNSLALDILLTVAAGVADVLAGVLATAFRITRVYLEVVVALGAGFILAAALLEPIPEAVAENPHAGPLIALGYITLFLTENTFSRWAHKDQGDHNPMATSMGTRSSRNHTTRRGSSTQQRVSPPCSA